MKAAIDLQGALRWRARGSATHRCVAALVVLLGTSALILASLEAPVEAKASQPSPALAAVPAAAADDTVTDPFRRYALSALLVPLLDDRQPPHWTDAALRYLCGPDTRVEIDGRPMVPGAAIPATAFSVRWHADECWPLDHDTLAMSGSVELRVIHEGEGLSATIDAGHLRIATARGSGRLDAPFTAWMSIAAAAPEHSP